MTFQLNKSFFKGATIQGFHGGETNVPRDPADCASWGHGSVALTVKVGFFDEPPPPPGRHWEYISPCKTQERLEPSKSMVLEEWNFLATMEIFGCYTSSFQWVTIQLSTNQEPNCQWAHPISSGQIVVSRGHPEFWLSTGPPESFP